MSSYEVQNQIPRKIITCNIMGGLGNQLFQIATTIAYAIRMKCAFVFPYSIEVFKNRFSYWHSFLSSLRSFTTENPKCKRTNTDLNYLSKYPERAFHFTPIPEFDRSVFLQGYFQSYLYFEKEKEAFFQYIRLREQQEKIRAIYSDYFPENVVTVSMHFRIGDYQFLPEFHPILPFAYYQRALDLLLCKVSENSEKPIHVLYFCEKGDHGLVCENILESLEFDRSRVSLVYVEDGMEDWQQMLMMSLCDHHIIANSTFSWWGAYFHSPRVPMEEPMILYPSLWFGPALQEKVVSDLFPKNWIQITV
jgi:hypothetical protein